MRLGLYERLPARYRRRNKAGKLVSDVYVPSVAIAKLRFLRFVSRHGADERYRGEMRKLLNEYYCLVGGR